MQIQIEGAALESAVKAVGRITSNASMLTFTVVNSSQIRVEGSNKGTSMSKRVPCSVTTKSDNKQFSVAPASILAALTKRNELKLTIKKGLVQITGEKGYYVELISSEVDNQPVIPEEIKSGKDSKGILITQDTLAFVGKNLPLIELKPIFDYDAFMPVALRLTSKGATLVCYDNWHMACVTSKAIKGDMQLCLPVSSLLQLTQEFQDQEYTLRLTDSVVYAYNKSFELSMAIPQADGQNVIAPDSAFDLVTSLRKLEGVSITLNNEDVQTISENLTAVYRNKSEHVQFDVTKDKCMVTFKTTNGQVKAAVRCKSETSLMFRISYTLFKDVLRKATDSKIELTVVPDKMLFFSTDERLIMSSLWSE